MNTRRVLLLIIALIIACGTIILARSVVRSGQVKTVEKAETPTTSEILVASRDVASGAILRENDLKWQAWPKENLSDSFYVKGTHEMSVVAGSVVRQGFRSGDPIVKGRVVQSTQQGFLSAVLLPGMRAISVQLTPAGGVAGLVFPGDRVDVIVTHKIQNELGGDRGSDRIVSETVVTDVRVLALDQKTNDQNREPKVAQLATLEVTPRQAEEVALMREMGTISLILRSLATDSEKSQGIKVSTDSLTWDSDISQVLPEPYTRKGQVMRVQVMRGKEKTESVFGAP